MKKCYLAILLMLPLLGIYANDSIRQYYSLVSLAEEQICEGNTSQAALLYRNAFSYKTYPFYPDLCNALICEIKQDEINDRLCLEYFDMLLNKGFMKDRDTSAIKRADLMGELIRHPKWQMFKDRLLAHNFEYSELNGIVDFMIKRDQAIRRLNDKDYGDLYDIRGMDRVDSVDNLNLIQLLELLKTDMQCLDENIVGIDDVGHIIVLVLHHTGSYPNNREIRFGDIKDYLYKAVKEGVLDARRYADNYDRYLQNLPMPDKYGYGSYLPCVFCLNRKSDTIAKTFDCEGGYIALIDINRNDSLRLKDVDTININRYDIYLDDVMKASIRRVWFHRQSLFARAMNIWMIPDFPGLDIKQIIRDLVNKDNLWYYIKYENDIDIK